MTCGTSASDMRAVRSILEQRSNDDFVNVILLTAMGSVSSGHANLLRKVFCTGVVTLRRTASRQQCLFCTTVIPRCVCCTSSFQRVCAHIVGQAQHSNTVGAPSVVRVV